MAAVGRFVVRPLGFDRVAFRAIWDDPVRCCSKKSANNGRDTLSFACGFSGVDLVEAHGRAWQEADVVVLEWCSANLSTAKVVNRDRVTLERKPGARAVFRVTGEVCKDER